MIFRPSFCANCGEKIERKEWHLWTSRRFCQVCESEFKGQDLVPRVIVIIAVVATLVGFRGYWRAAAGESGSLVERRSKNVTELSLSTQSANTAQTPSTSPKDGRSATQVNRAGNAAESQPRTLAALPPQKLNAERTIEAEAAYYCGAQTKKGTACTRRVKGNVRCFQHTGMPSMLPPNKLKIG